MAKIDIAKLWLQLIHPKIVEWLVKRKMRNQDLGDVV